MKKVYIVSKFVGLKELFLFVRDDGFYFWKEQIDQASQYKTEKEANNAMHNIQKGTIGNFFKITAYYLTNEKRATKQVLFDNI